jgi:hypothetical protein
VVPEVPEAWQEAAETVRAHLCAFRGGGPFLSPADCLQLVAWLEAGIRVDAVLVAVERAADARRKSKRKGPLSLVAARRHLGKPVPDRFFREPPPASEPVLAPVARTLVGPETEELARELLAATELLPALVAVRRFLDTVWEAIGAEGRADLRSQATVELGDLVELVDGPVREGLIDECARDLLRQRYPVLAAGTLARLFGG